MDHDYLWGLSRFEHKPVRPPREGHLGENVFYRNWLKQMTANDSLDDHANQQFVDVLGGYAHRLSERTATVAATFITWLGTNLGNAYRCDAKRLVAVQEKARFDHSDAYLWAWASTNLRRSGSGAGLRQLEASMGGYEKDPPLLSAEDYEVADHLAFWLGTDDGQAFLERCEAEIKQHQHDHDFRSYLEKSLHLPGVQVDHILDMAKGYRATEVQAQPQP
jgi:hypothetical protein